MPKGRMSTLDVRAMCLHLRATYLGARLANIYNVNNKMYLFKLAKSAEIKAMMLMESGVRFHLTKYQRDKSNIPSGFTFKIRKHIRMKRLEDVRQLGMDRTIDFTFGSGDATHHIILELFAGGNIILTDADYVILSLLRTHVDDSTGLRYACKEKYPAVLFKVPQPPNSDLFMKLLSEAKPEDKVKDVLSAKSDYGPSLVEHALLVANIPDKYLVSQLEAESAEMEAIVKAFVGIDTMMADEQLGKAGYIILFDKKGGSGSAAAAAGEAGGSVDFAVAKDIKFDEFSPVLLEQYRSRKWTELPSFDDAMDEFFAKSEGQRLDAQRQAQESAAMKKIERVKKDHEQRIQQLQQEQEQLEESAYLIQCNLADVDAAILVLNSAIANGTDWSELKNIIRAEQRAGNPVANIIHKVNFETNHVTLLLTNNLDNLDEEEQTKPMKLVEVDLGLNAHANTQVFYEKKKKCASKETKTAQAGERAIKGAENKAMEELKKVEAVARIQTIRKTHWFEKFNWFISSEDFVVVAGRDMQQNEILVKRYLGKNDVYVHADVHGAASCIVRNHTSNPIPALTLAQAGSFCVCRSQAWDSKIVTSAYWVNADQVSKTAPTGEYLPTGSFMIRGKKNFLPVSPLIMGFGILFKVDDASIARHVGERHIRGADEAVPTASAEESMEMSVGRDDDDNDDDDNDGDNGNDDNGNDDNGHNEGANQQQQQQQAAIAPPTDTAATAAASTMTTSTLERSGSREVQGADGSTVRVALVGKDAFEDSDEEEEAELPSALRSESSGASKKHLSAAERRRLKKGVSLDEQRSQRHQPQQPPAPSSSSSSSEEEEEEEDDNASNTSKQKPVSLPRGKKKKLEKAKQKYADQDEEERSLMMQLLGSNAVEKGRGKQTKAERKAARPKSAAAVARLAQQQQKSEAAAVDVESAREAMQKLTATDGNKTCWKCGSDAHLATACPQSRGRTAAKKEARKDKEQVDALIAEEGLAELDDDQKAKANDTVALTALPVEEDTLLFAMAFCAPYQVLQNFKYKIKLLPGGQRKGKAGKSACDMFCLQANCSAREKELIKIIPDNELTMSMINNVRLVSGSEKPAKGKPKNKK